MGKKKKIILSSLVSLVLAGGGALGYLYWNATKEVSVDKNASVATNYYQAINKEWLTKTKIPSDKPSVATFTDLQEKIDDRLEKDIENLVKNESKQDSSDKKALVAFYKLATDFDQREKDGLKPLQNYLKPIEDLKTFDEFVANMEHLAENNYTLPFAMGIGVDTRDSNKKIMEYSSPRSILPDVTSYQDEATKKQILTIYEQSTLKSLKAYGYTEKEAKQLLKDTVAFDALLVPHLMSYEEMSKIENAINIVPLSQIDQKTGDLKLGQLAKKLTQTELTEVNVATTKYYEAFSDIVNEKNFKLMKSWMLVNEITGAAAYLTEEFRQASSDYGKTLSGLPELMSKEDLALAQVQDVFSETLSVHYGKTYFGDEAKKDVTRMIEEVAAVYKERLKNNTWLSQQTKEKAIQKLDSIKSFVGYPEEVSEVTKGITIDPKRSYFDNRQSISNYILSDSFKRFAEPVDKTVWVAPAFQVNAFYTPVSNAIYFPAAILQKPFYDKDQSAATNLGSIGTVIGHELSHAFDNNGAQFDENGNFQEWWTKEDFKLFEKKTKAMVDLFDGIKIFGGKVNGQLTVGENIADAGGLSAAFEVFSNTNKKEDDKAFFEAYAKIWASKLREQYAQLLLLQDTHAPDELRTNVQLKNFDAFYESYPLTEKDPMYLPKDQRVKIW